MTEYDWDWTEGGIFKSIDGADNAGGYIFDLKQRMAEMLSRHHEEMAALAFLSSGNISSGEYRIYGAPKAEG